LLSFNVAGHQFDLRAAAIVLREKDVLLHRLAGDSYWSLPGGRVEPGEAAQEAVIRECAEELGESVSCGELVWVVENFFDGAGGKHHEIGLYFRASLPPSSRLLALNGTFFGIEGAKRLEFAWFDRGRLGDTDVRPSFLISALGEAELRFQHVVQR